MSNKNYNKEEMISITKAAMRYLDSWRLKNEEIINILGLGDTTKKRSLQHFRSGSKTLPQEPEVMQRIEHIAGIIEALRTAYPMNTHMRVKWLYNPCRRFQGKNPLSIILAEGMDGLIKARIEIDCAYGWELSKQMKTKSQSG